MTNLIKHYLKIDLDIIFSGTLLLSMLSSHENFVFFFYFITLLALPRFGQWWTQQTMILASSSIAHDYNFFPSINRKIIDPIINKKTDTNINEFRQNVHFEQSYKKPKVHLKEIKNDKEFHSN